MKTNTAKILGKARPKVTALLRSRPFYKVEDLILQFKTHILGLLELNIGGFYHACDTELSQINRVQTSFVHSLDLSVETAFMEHNLLPLSARRDIAMLGLLFRCAHGDAHPELLELFPRNYCRHGFPTRSEENRHSHQIAEPPGGTHHEFVRRSIFGLVRVWN